MEITATLLQAVSAIAVKAGKAILEVYHSGDKIQVAVKADYTPLTIADQQSHHIIVQGLEAFNENIPVLSEEGADIPYSERKQWDEFWCVDPLDGTKEFINRRDEFTVNIALIRQGKPVLGVIYAPVYDTLYYGAAGRGSWKQNKKQTIEPLHVDNAATAWTAIGSRSHASAAEAEVLNAYPVVKTIAAGSSLKFCRVAEGAAHIYYRHGPTMEWDTAAGQAIAENAGAIMIGADGTPFLYNKPSLLNSSFICRVR